MRKGLAIILLHLVLTSGCAMLDEKKEPPRETRAEDPSEPQLKLRFGSPRSQGKTQDEQKNDSYDSRERDDLLEDQAIGVTGTWQF